MDPPSKKCAAGESDNSCLATPPHPTGLSTILSLSPFIATFILVCIIIITKVFPRLSRIQQNSRNKSLDDGEDHILPPSAPLSLKQAHVAHRTSTPAARRKERVACWTFAVTVGLTAVLGELILAEISGWVGGYARGVALGFTVPTLVGLLVVVIPFLEIWSVIGGGGGKGKWRWVVQMVGFGIWLGGFWYVGRAVPPVDEQEYLIYAYGGLGNGGAGKGEGGFDSTGLTIGRAESRQESVGDVIGFGGGGLSRACLERIGVIGILLMALLSGFASVSNPWYWFVEGREYKRRPVSEGDVARKVAGLEATGELLGTKRHRLRSLQRKIAMGEVGGGGEGRGLVGKMLGGLREVVGGGSGDAAEVRGLMVEIKGLEDMERNLAEEVRVLRSRRAAHKRDGTVLGRVMAVPGVVFSIYCVYRVLATALTTARRMYYPTASFSSSDPINRFLGLLAKHWDPKLDQIAWARQISFLLSGVILAASANSVLQTFRLFAKWAPGLLYQAQANLALLLGQIAATYVISAALLMRSNLPREVGQSVGDALESALQPGFVDRWFEGWFLVASLVTALGIWVGRRFAGGGLGEGWDGDYWDEVGAVEMGTKRS